MRTEPHVAGHATHFLRRLERVEDDHVQLALALYRDSDLLQAVLGHASLPEGAERVAISLDDPREGPFVVVTREGRFVTCLGKGMSTSDLPIVTRQRLEIAAGRVERMRERLANLRSLEETDRSETSQLFRRLSEGGPYLAREDVESLVRWEALLSNTYLTAAIDNHHEVLRLYPYLATLRADRPLPDHTKAVLEAWWNCLWGLAHLAPLVHAGEGSRDLFELETDPSLGIRKSTSTWLLNFAVVSIGTRGLWCVGRGARALLPHVKREPDANAFVGCVRREYALALIAHASSRSRAEAERALYSARRSAADGGYEGGELEQQWYDQMRMLLRDGLEGPRERVLELFDDVLRRDLERWIDPSRRTHPAPLDSLSEAPPSILRAVFASLPVSWLSDLHTLLPLALAVPWLARCRLEELYLPREWTRALARPFEPEQALELIKHMRYTLGGGPVQTVRRPPSPGRNDPCACGSGKKFKRCCG